MGSQNLDHIGQFHPRVGKQKMLKDIDSIPADEILNRFPSVSQVFGLKQFLGGLSLFRTCCVSVF
jgi:hypothetical protein